VAAAFHYNAAIVIANENDNTRGPSAARRTVVGRVQRSLVGGGWNSSSPDDPDRGDDEDGW